VLLLDKAVSCHAVLRCAMLLGRSTKQEKTGMSMQYVKYSLWRVLAEHVVLQVIKQASKQACVM